jgi:hypothetical protein
MPPLLTEEESALDPYALLNLDTSADEKAVRKAYRQLSLKYHPDRNPDPAAAAKFREISLSLEILVDHAKRAYVDTRLEAERVRKERYAELDKKRKKLVDDLNAREEEAKKARVDQVERGKRMQEEERVMEEGRRMMEEAKKRRAASAQAAAATNAAGSDGHAMDKGRVGMADRRGVTARLRQTVRHILQMHRHHRAVLNRPSLPHRYPLRSKSLRHIRSTRPTTPLSYHPSSRPTRPWLLCRSRRHRKQQEQVQIRPASLKRAS